MRLQKYLARAGVASRRKSEEYITSGRVEVNGETVRELGTKVNPVQDEVRYMGRIVDLPSEFTYIMLHKPAGYLSTCKDDRGRKTVLDLVDKNKRLFPVGRLDFTSEGLLLLTNDGKLTNQLTHPKHEVEKKYLVVIDSDITEDEIKQLERGVTLDKGERTAPAVMKALSITPDRSELFCVLREGMNRQVRRMFMAVDKNVVYLKRVAIGSLELGNLKKGECRDLSEKEIKYLQSL